MPVAESLKDLIDSRTVPFWKSVVEPKIAGKIKFKDKIGQPLNLYSCDFLNKGFPKKIFGMINNCHVAILAQFTIGP